MTKLQTLWKLRKLVSEQGDCELLAETDALIVEVGDLSHGSIHLLRTLSVLSQATVLNADAWQPKLYVTRKVQGQMQTVWEGIDINYWELAVGMDAPLIRQCFHTLTAVLNYSGVGHNIKGGWDEVDDMRKTCQAIHFHLETFCDVV